MLRLCLFAASLREPDGARSCSRTQPCFRELFVCVCLSSPISRTRGGVNGGQVSLEFRCTASFLQVGMLRVGTTVLHGGGGAARGREGRGAPRGGHARGGGGGSRERDWEARGVAPAARARSARSAQLGDDEGDHAARSASRGQEPTPSPLSTRVEDRDEPAAQGRPGWRIETSLRRKSRPGWRVETSLRRASVPAARRSGGCRRSR